MTTTTIAARTPDGQTLLILRPNGFFVWRSDAPSTVKKLEINDRIESVGRGQPPLIGLDPTGSRIYYFNTRNDQIRLSARPLDGNEARPVTWSLNVAPLTTLAVSPDGKNLAIGERSGAVTLIDAIHGTVKERLSPPDDESGPVESLTFAPSSQILAVGAREQVRLWSIDAQPRSLVRLPGHRGSIRSLAFDTRGTRLAGADEKTIKVWDLTSLRSELAKLGLDW